VPNAAYAKIILREPVLAGADWRCFRHSSNVTNFVYSGGPNLALSTAAGTRESYDGYQSRGVESLLSDLEAGMRGFMASELQGRLANFEQGVDGRIARIKTSVAIATPSIQRRSRRLLP
jgi:hypothetical protein